MPMEPGGTAQVSTQATTDLNFQLQDKHAEAHHIHGNNHIMDSALIYMVLKSVDSMYIFALHKFFTGYMG